ncbi:16S rRNA (cytosine(1402)-N(4))-methyltransferase, partial [Nesterenkonia massiliensis]|uniref:16S rRNA (cytosine(1402)-N(4))-methyltransferase n=1 Tax=Nesterenkonia massiliensis TaxID=1232429 RepID=UPI001F31BEC0
MSERAAADRHIPVMRDRCIALLAQSVTTIQHDGSRPVVIDATLGMGGHSEAMLAAHPDVTVLGIDRDTQALKL